MKKQAKINIIVLLLSPHSQPFLHFNPVKDSALLLFKTGVTNIEGTIVPAEQKTFVLLYTIERGGDQSGIGWIFTTKLCPSSSSNLFKPNLNLKTDLNTPPLHLPNVVKI